MAGDRAQQILNTAVQVAPTGIGVWQTTSRTGPSTSVVIAPADLAWLLDRARIAEKAEAKVARVEALAEDWARDRIGSQSLALTYQFAAEKLRHALAEPERDEEGS